MQELTELKDLYSKMEYFKEVIKQAEKNTKDKNIIYEVVYSQKCLDEMLKDETISDITRAEIQEIKTSFEMLLESIPEEDAVNSLGKNSVTLGKIDRIKNKVINSGFKGTYDKKSYHSENLGVSYLKNRIPTFVALTALILAQPVIPELASFVANMVSRLLGADAVASVSSYTDAIAPIVGVVFTLILMIAVMVKSCRMMVDIVYITMPSMRQLIGKFNFLSQHLDETFKSDYDVEIVVTKVKEPDRIKRSIEILKCLTEEFKDSDKLKKLNNEVQNNSNKKQIYYLAAEIEYIYDKVLANDRFMIDLLENKGIKNLGFEGLG